MLHWTRVGKELNKNEWLCEKNLNQNSSYKMSALVKVIAWEWCNARETEIKRILWSIKW